MACCGLQPGSQVWTRCKVRLPVYTIVLSASASWPGRQLQQRQRWPPGCLGAALMMAVQTVRRNLGPSRALCPHSGRVPQPVCASEAAVTALPPADDPAFIPEPKAKGRAKAAAKPKAAPPAAKPPPPGKPPGKRAKSIPSACVCAKACQGMTKSSSMRDMASSRMQ